MSTIGELREALRPAGNVYAWTRLTLEGGTWFDHSLRLHKTELLEKLAELPADTPCVPFYSVGNGGRRSHRVFIGRAAPHTAGAAL